MSHWKEALAAALGRPDAVRTGDSVRNQHAGDLTYHTPHAPDAVVYPRSTVEVATVLRFANEHRIPVTPYGVGTSLEGHTIPLMGGITLNMTEMNQILEVRPGDFLVRVQPGVTRVALNHHLRSYGLQFPLDPGADATLGGMCATNASGTTAVRYGVMRNQVMDLEVVLADGTVIRTGSQAFKSSAGYHLTGLFVGSEGTLGVITELTLRLHAIPEHTAAARAVFASVRDACQAAYDIIASGVPIGRVELVDALTVSAVNRLKGTDYPEQPTLFLEVHGTQAAVAADLQLVLDICRENGAKAVVQETDPARRHQLWEARHDAALAISATAPGKKMKITDVCMPLSELPDAIHHARTTIDARGIYGAILGHVGDGNYHVQFMVNPEDKAELRAADEVNAELVRYALARGGTCTGEHGVGIGKMGFLREEHASTIGLMQQIKRAFDPNNILNPGKVFTME
ncbi:2-hydroxy-acid oxidase [Alicyclobacillus contaminans]|uniref:FAD-binding oxidoreductase n=1 Tax=Alicyclobacillus contaminans TaxID=392016 RepID=UPI0004025F7B|nr:FAD-linked oxidase C-terminal domain-containing protein [Alicyclobacillus contaminans]GMA51064.1 2-hydroxy-acid oxidase [Alicyclobacillus contaminans]